MQTTKEERQALMAIAVFMGWRFEDAKPNQPYKAWGPDYKSPDEYPINSSSGSWDKDLFETTVSAKLAKFKTSFDWLIPVWVKFRGLHRAYYGTGKETEYINSVGDLLDRFLESQKPEDFFPHMARAIEWHNDNCPEPVNKEQ